MHTQCEDSLHPLLDIITFPMDHVEIHYTYLFEIGGQHSDRDYIFTNYYNEVFELYITQNEWSMLLDLDDISEIRDLQLIIPLVKSKILMVSLFYEELLE